MTLSQDLAMAAANSDIEAKNQSGVGKDSAPWCRLISQQPQGKSVIICKPQFIIGAEENCDLVINHPDSHAQICKIFQHKCGKDVFFAKICCTSDNNTVQIDNCALSLLKSCAMRSGTELIFSCGQTTYAYIFQQLRGNKSIYNDNMSHSVSSSNSISLTNSDMPHDDGEVSFNNFPYYLSEKTKHNLVGDTFFHMKTLRDQTSSEQLNQSEKLKILLSGPAGSEIYQEKLCMALAHYFRSKCFVVDSLWYPITAINPETEKNTAFKFFSPSNEEFNEPYFRVGDRVVYTSLNFGLSSAMCPSRGPTLGSRGKVAFYFGSDYKIGVIFDTLMSQGIDLGGACKQGYGFLCNIDEVVLEPKREEDYKILLSAVFLKAIESESMNCPLFLFMRDIKKFLEDFSSLSSPLKKDEDGNKVGATTSKSVIDKLSKNVILIGSHMYTDENKVVAIPRLVADMFPCQISIDMPEDMKELQDLKHNFKADAQRILAVRNKFLLQNMSKQRGLTFEDNDTFFVTDQVLTVKDAQFIISSAIGYQVMHNRDDSLKSEICLSTESISHGISVLKSKPTSLLEVQNIQTGSNTIEKRILEKAVVMSSNTGVKFDDIGALDYVKDFLKELVVYPFKRPELFSKCKLCKGILLFGPPGTGKTLLAKAVANEAGAYLINISMATICSTESISESIQYVKAVFSVASKIAPCVIFIDKVDSILGKRSSTENEVRRTVKNEIMSNWDDLATNDKSRVVVLAATNRPYDLDEAVISRLPHRLIVNLPDASDRSKILKVLLAKQNISPNFDFDELANMTPDYSGSDLKNLCVAAAYLPLREFIENENKRRTLSEWKETALAEGKPTPVSDSNHDIRSLDMNDFRCANQQVTASSPSVSRVEKQLLKWNRMYAVGYSPRSPPPLHPFCY